MHMNQHEYSRFLEFLQDRGGRKQAMFSVGSQANGPEIRLSFCPRDRTSPDRAGWSRSCQQRKWMRRAMASARLHALFFDDRCSDWTCEDFDEFSSSLGQSCVGMYAG